MDSTIVSLHRASQMMSAIRKSCIPPQPNALHLSLYVSPTGLTTGVLPDGESYHLHFARGEIEHRQSDEESLRVKLDGKTPEAIATALSFDGLKLEETSPLTIDYDAGADYAHLLFSVYTAMSRFRARLNGMMTPLVVWSHHFDLSFLWFRGDLADEHNHPHINFGFAPFSEGFDQPYVYVYAWSQLGYLNIEPQTPARMINDPFTGAIIDYPALKRYIDMGAMLERVLDDIYRQFAPYL